MSKQKTLKGSFSLCGKGLHTGLSLTVTFNPAPENTGYKIQRIDLDGMPTIQAIAENVIDTQRGTVLGKGDMRVSTIEHGMAALYAMGIDNCLIQVNGPEFPILDGSAALYVDKINEVGIEEQNAPKDWYIIRHKIEVKDEETGSCITILPDEEFSLTAMCSFNSKFVSSQFATLDCIDKFGTDIAPARTFVFVRDIEPLLKANLIKGGDLDNAIVVVENPVPDEQLEHLKKLFDKPDIEIKSGYLNNLELRCNNELARHKLLDLLGDFALLGVRIKGRVWATRPGHFANTEFMKQLKHAIRKAGEKPRFTYDCRKPALYDINDIRRMLPHRPPFLLVDRIFHRDETDVAGIKNVTMNEPFFVGHFPEEPVMPGVLIVEAMAQCSGILVLGGVEDPENYSTYFMKIDGVKFKRKVVPGDTLQFEIHLLEPIRRGVAVVEGKAFVGETLACEAVMMAQVVKNRK